MGKLNEIMNAAEWMFDNTPWQYDENNYVIKDFGNSVLFRHRYIAEKALGKPLPIGTEVHHVNGHPANNKWYNLVICQDKEYHVLLHERTKLVFGEEDTFRNLRQHRREFFEGVRAQAEGREPRSREAEKANMYRQMLEFCDWWDSRRTDFSSLDNVWSN